MMKIFRSLFVIQLLFMSNQAQAIRSVGNGGGEAEMTLLQQFSSLPTWLKFCSENSSICFSNQLIDKSSLLKAIRWLESTGQPIEFILNGKADLSAPKKIEISVDDLYIDIDTPIADLELTKLLLKTVFQKSNVQLNLKPQISIDGVALSGDEFGYVRTKSSDYLVAKNTSFNLHKEVSRQIHSEAYVVLNFRKGEYLIQDLISKNVFSVVYQIENHKIALFVRLQLD